MWAGARAIGTAHLARGLPCQDVFVCRIWQEGAHPPVLISANRLRSASLLKYRPGAGLVTLPAPCRRAPAPLAARLLRLRRARTRCEATIDHKLRTGHVARCVGGEE